MALFAKFETADWINALALGFFGGLLSLTRSAFAAFLPFLALALGVQCLVKKKNLALVVLLCFGWMVPIGCWTARNWVLYHQFIPLTVQTGQGLYFGLARSAEEREVRKQEVLAEQTQLGLGPENWLKRDKYFKDKSIAYIKSHPGEYVVTLLINNFRFWRPWPYPPYPLYLRVGLGAYYSILFLLSLAGIWVLRDRLLDFLPVFAYLIGTTIVQSFFDVTFRYRIPLEPFLCVFAAAGFLYAVLGRFRAVTII
jgi:hypothetical protein